MPSAQHGGMARTPFPVLPQAPHPPPPQGTTLRARLTPPNCTHLPHVFICIPVNFGEVWTIRMPVRAARELIAAGAPSCPALHGRSDRETDDGAKGCGRKRRGDHEKGRRRRERQHGHRARRRQQCAGRQVRVEGQIRRQIPGRGRRQAGGPLSLRLGRRSLFPV